MSSHTALNTVANKLSQQSLPEQFNLDRVDPSWRSCIKEGLTQLDPAYLHALLASSDWLPGKELIFSAFSLPLNKTQYILFGESPYPRKISANGYAFWDNAVNELWSDTGLSKAVNRATSLRNIIKMLLIAENALAPNCTSQEAIAQIDKSAFVQTNNALFHHFLQQGFLLLNATPVLQLGQKQVQKEARHWQPFIRHVLNFIFAHNPNVQLILLGRIATTIDQLINQHPFKKLYAEHPYNISFIHNQDVLAFFKPLHLLVKNKT